MKPYRKTYAPIIWWTFGTFAGLLILALATTDFLSVADGTRLTLLAAMLSIDILMAIIYFGEHIYWLNGGPSFEQAKNAGSEARRAYALPFLRRFLIATLIYLAYMILAHFMQWPIVGDIAVMTGVCIITALSTCRIRL